MMIITFLLKANIGQAVIGVLLL